jgi:hypothetical protein
MSGRDQSRKGSAGSKPCRKTASRRTGLSARDGYPSIVREREKERERERERDLQCKQATFSRWQDVSSGKGEERLASSS